MGNFMGPVISKQSFDKIMGYVEKAKAAGGEVIYGGTGDDKKGFFVQPTVIVTNDPKSVTMKEEIFGPVVTVYVYEDAEFEQTCKLIDETTEYALTGCMCVAPIMNCSLTDAVLPAASRRTAARSSRRTTCSGIRPACSTSTTSARAPSSDSSLSVARGPGELLR